jgi:membrane-bound ClpP family serine protease
MTKKFSGKETWQKATLGQQISLVALSIAGIFFLSLGLIYPGFGLFLLFSTMIVSFIWGGLHLIFNPIRKRYLP